MKINKTLIILSLLLIFCISLGAVSAADNTDMRVNDINNEDVATVESSVNVDDEISTVSEEGQINKSSEIYEEIKNATGTYNITNDYQIDQTWNISNDNVIIEGNNHTIYGNGNRAFYIMGNNVTIKNLNFVNCSSNGAGGAILIFSGSVSGCSFVGCSASHEGGAICFMLASSTGDVNSCSFVNCNNSVNNGHSYGGAISFSGSGSVSDCSFVNCNSNVNVSDRCNSYGGAIHFHKGGSVSGCSFVNCMCRGSDRNGNSYGGVISFNNKGSVSGCYFLSCTSICWSTREPNVQSRGGAIYFKDSGSVSGCSFVNCSSICKYTPSGMGGCGGAILFSGSGSVNYCVFDNNKASHYGNAIYVIGSATVDNDFNFFAFQNNVTEFPKDLIKGNTPSNWVVLDIVNSSDEYVVKFVLNNGSDLSKFMPNYTANLTINKVTTRICIKNNTFNSTFVDGDYLLTSLNTKKVLANTHLGRFNTTYNIATGDYDGDVIVIVNFPTDVTGNVSIKIDNQKITKIIQKGSVTFIIKGLSAGNHTLNISYSGDKKYFPFNKLINVTVDKIHIDIIPTALSTTYGSGDYFTVKVLDKNKKPVSGVKLTLKIYTGSKVNKTVTITTDNNGIAKYSASKLSIGTHKVVITLSNPNYIVDSNKNSSITISKAKKSSMEEEDNGKEAVSYNNGNNRISNSVGNMENCGTPLIALLIALISLPILRRRK